MTQHRARPSRPPKQRRAQRPWVHRGIPAVLVAALVGGGTVATRAFASSSPADSYRTATVSRADVQENVSSTGTVAKVRQKAASFAVSGTVRSVHVAVGDHVRLGQILASLDSAPLQDAVTGAKATLARDVASLESDEAASTTSTSGTTSTGTASTAAFVTGPGTGTGTGTGTAYSTGSSGPTAVAVPALYLSPPTTVGVDVAAPGSTAGRLAAAAAAVASAQRAVVSAQRVTTTAANAVTTAQQLQTRACAPVLKPPASPSTQGTSPTSPSSSSSSSSSSSPVIVPRRDQLAACVAAVQGTTTAQAAYGSAQQGTSSAQATLSSALTAQAALLRSLAGAPGPTRTPGSPTPSSPTTSTHPTTPSPPSRTSKPTSPSRSGSTGSTGSTGGTPSRSGARTSSPSPSPSRTSTARGSGAGGSTTSGSGSGANRQGTSPSATTAAGLAARVAADRQAVTTARAALTSATRDVTAATLTSPLDGTVGSVGYTAGQATGSGSIEIVGSGAVSVTTTVPLNAIGKVEVGQSARVSAAGSAAPLPGTVQSISLLPSSTATSTPTFPVVVLVPRPTPALAIGSTASVTVSVRTVRDVLSVPNSALTPISATRASLLVMSGTSTTRTQVTTGAVGSTRTQVTSGVAAGQRVVLADLSTPLPANTFGRRLGAGTGGGFAGGGGGFGAGSFGTGGAPAGGTARQGAP